MHKLISGLLVSLVLLSGQSPADKPPNETALLVEARVVPRCNGLDCPPLPVPFDAYLCFQVKDTYYTGTYSPWGFPWAPPGKRLLALQQKSVEIAVTNERIRVVAPFKVSLKKLHNYGQFRLASCNQA
jgi:hypothetical protein